ncbi:MAG: glycerophosphodiester phosphodiesterase family protein [Mycobacteriaceae bacterium]
MSAPIGVVAHRGASAEKPEHTLAAYELALRAGADAVECDVRLTRDGHLVCVHDRRVDRTSTGRGVVSGMTLQRMAALDYASWHVPVPDLPDGGVDGVSGAGAVDGVDPDAVDRRVFFPPDEGAFAIDPGPDPAVAGTLLTLRQLLELVVAHDSARVFVETKHPVRYGGLVEAKVVAELHRFGLARPTDPAQARATVMSFSPSAVWRVHRAAPAVPTVLLSHTAAPLAAAVGRTTIGPKIKILRGDPGIVRRAAAQGRDTYAWTVDTREDLDLCRSLGVRWVATNRPASLRRWIDSA